MSDFQTSLKIVFFNEGTELISDSGGLTKYGISKKRFPDEDIANMTIERASYLYENFYWRFDRIVNQKTANQLFDSAVNIGLKRTIKMVQRVLNSLLFNLAVDGVLGMKTLNAINSYSTLSLNDKIFIARIRYYQKLAKRKKYAEYLFQWVTRTINAYRGIYRGLKK